ncbi:MAG TPA: GNAT family N-acetyltransferase [Bacteroidia bacterium]|nr:GNAT family N-acetyltransferase [Bacteroidia bacterium]
MPSVSLSQANASDIPLICTLADTIWREHYIPMIGQPQVDYMLASMYSPESLADQMKDGHQFYLIITNNSPAGYLSVSSQGNNEYFLHKFYVESEKQGRGLGKASFGELLGMLDDARTIRLTVNRKNYKSINFYFRLGFIIEEVKDIDIGSGFLMKDFIMTLRR